MTTCPLLATAVFPRRTLHPDWCRRQKRSEFEIERENEDSGVTKLTGKQGEFVLFHRGWPSQWFPSDFRDENGQVRGSCRNTRNALR